MAAGRLTALCADAAEAGVDLIQVREPDLSARDLYALVADAVRVTRGSSTRVVVNGRADVALAAGADGVHLPASGIPVECVRSVAPLGWVIGRSAHSAGELAAATAGDYIIFGTVFDTASKPGVTGQGLASLREATRSVVAPVLAIGGITAARVRACALAGASGVAAISLFLEAEPGGMAPRDAVRMVRHAFGAD